MSGTSSVSYIGESPAMPNEIATLNDVEYMATTGKGDKDSAILGNYQPKVLRPEHHDELHNTNVVKSGFEVGIPDVQRSNLQQEMVGDTETMITTGSVDNDIAALGNFQPKVLQPARSPHGVYNIGTRETQSEVGLQTKGRYIKSNKRKAPHRPNTKQHNNTIGHFNDSIDRVVNGIENVSLSSNSSVNTRVGNPEVNGPHIPEPDYDETEIVINFTAEDQVPGEMAPPEKIQRIWKKGDYEGEDFAKYFREDDDGDDKEQHKSSSLSPKTKKQSHKSDAKTNSRPTPAIRLGTSMMEFLRQSSPSSNIPTDPKRNMKTFSFADSKIGRTEISDTYMNRTLPRLANKKENSQTFGLPEADSYVQSHEINYESYLTYRRTNYKPVHGAVERNSSDSGNETSDDSAKQNIYQKMNRNFTGSEPHIPGLVYDASNSHTPIFGKQSLWKKLTLRFKKRRSTRDMQLPIDKNMTYHSMKVN